MLNYISMFVNSSSFGSEKIKVTWYQYWH